jgi:hypothetical protein
MWCVVESWTILFINSLIILKSFEFVSKTNKICSFLSNKKETGDILFWLMTLDSDSDSDYINIITLRL